MGPGGAFAVGGLSSDASLPWSDLSRCRSLSFLCFLRSSRSLSFVLSFSLCLCLSFFFFFSVLIRCGSSWSLADAINGSPVSVCSTSELVAVRDAAEATVVGANRLLIVAGAFISGASVLMLTVSGIVTIGPLAPDSCDVTLLSIPNLLSCCRLSFSNELTSAGFVSMPLIVLGKPLLLLLLLLIPAPKLGFESLSNGCESSEPGSPNENIEKLSPVSLSNVFERSNEDENNASVGDVGSTLRTFDSRKSVPSSWRTCSLPVSDRLTAEAVIDALGCFPPRPSKSVGSTVLLPPGMESVGADIDSKLRFKLELDEEDFCFWPPPTAIGSTRRSFLGVSERCFCCCCC
uniref:(northern house mosquito) hypothetical protein n=1 Tax=Culex pipiens TaxID=7175 RepID=A0A8D8F642_CULPI